MYKIQKQRMVEKALEMVHVEEEEDLLQIRSMGTHSQKDHVGVSNSGPCLMQHHLCDNFWRKYATVTRVSWS